MKVETRLHACSIECIGDMELDKKLFACGMYELDENNIERAGEVVLYDGNTGQILNVTPCTSGVLDIKATNQFLSVALSGGTLEVYSVETGNDFMQPALLRTSTISDCTQGLFLSVDWNSALSSVGLMPSTCERDRSVVVSTQESSVILYQLGPTGFIETHRITKAHCLRGEIVPTWIVAFDKHSQQRIITGGDDNMLKLWDLRCGVSSPASVIKHHTAGVTSAQWHPVAEHIFAAGSYDESLCVWDDRSLRVPLLDLHTGETPLELNTSYTQSNFIDTFHHEMSKGGGVWRTKWCVPPAEAYGTKYSYIAAACMHGGSRMFQIDTDEWTCRDTCCHLDDASTNHLAYGIDVISIKAQDTEAIHTGLKSTKSTRDDNPEDCPRGVVDPATLHACPGDDSSSGLIATTGGSTAVAEEALFSCTDSESSHGTTTLPIENGSCTLAERSVAFDMASCSFYDNAIHLWQANFRL